MIIILPPSETKISGGMPGSSLRLSDLSFSSQTPARHELIDQLIELVADEQSALRALKLGPRGRSDVDRNREILQAPVMPALHRYTGVLFDSLSMSTLSQDARSWLLERVAIFSALFGLIRASDLIPAYRLSFDTVLAGGSIKSQWNSVSVNLWSEVPDFVIDLRSEGYRKLSPVPPGKGVTISLVKQKKDGTRKNLGHFNKAVKGQLVRKFSDSRPTLNSTSDLVEWGLKNEVLFESVSDGSDFLDLVVREN
tara:strand:- start:695 stop:1453 length:759 start_codon:yes stop_codon:yes gene_type:complete